MSASSQHADRTDVPTVERSLDELLGDAVVYEAGHAPPAPEVAATFDPSGDDSLSRGVDKREGRVSPVCWAAAVVWGLPGGIGGWWLLRETHPRTARRLLFIGIISFVILGATVIAMVVAQRALNPSYVFIRK